jgi:YbbR domain-containing protein
MVRRLVHKLGTLLLALLLATLVWITAVREQNPPREADYDRAIPIEIIPPAIGLVTTDILPQTVRLRLMAPENSWRSLTPSKFKAALDLSKLPEGFSDIPVQVNISDPAIRIIEQTPREVSLTLQPEQTISMPVSIDIMDEPPLGYIHRPPTVTPAQVTVTGPASLVNQVDRAVSEIYIRSSKNTVDRVSPVMLRNRADQILANLKPDPTNVQVTIPIEQRFGYKDVSVSAVVKGQPAVGYWVSNISINPSQLIIVGNPQALSAISGFIETAPIDVGQATQDIVQQVPLNLPNGVTVVQSGNQANSSAGGVEVVIKIAAIESGQTVQRSVSQQGIDPSYIWSVSPQQVDVILSGPIPRLQTLKPDEVKVIVELFGLSPGTHKIQPAVFLPDGLRVEAILPDTVEVVINPKPTFGPTATPTPVFEPR